MKIRSLLLIATFSVLAFAGIAQAQAGPGVTVAIYTVGSDYCQNPSIAKTSVAVNISSATTTELVAASAGKKVYLCKFNASVAGTAPTIIFKTGTKVSTACDTTPTSLTGTYAITTGTVLDLSGAPGVTMQSIVSGELCLTSGGTGPSIQGVAVYVQR
jgi:hypothetical protein